MGENLGKLKMNYILGSITDSMFNLLALLMILSSAEKMFLFLGDIQSVFMGEASLCL